MGILTHILTPHATEISVFAAEAITQPQPQHPQTLSNYDQWAYVRTTKNKEPRMVYLVGPEKSWKSLNLKDSLGNLDVGKCREPMSETTFSGVFRWNLRSNPAVARICSASGWTRSST
jgi:hypothetical protein